MTAATSHATQPRLRASRPVVLVDGRERPALAEALLALSVAEDVQGLARCEATFGNWGPSSGDTGFLYFDRALFDFGKALAIKVGADAVFDGRITALEGRFQPASPPELVVLAEDRLQEFRLTRRTRTFASVSDADVARRIASDHGLTATVSVTGPAHAVLAQVNQSDLAFLRDRARAIEAEVWVDGRMLHLAPRASRAGGAIRLGYGNELRECTATADLAGQHTAVVAAGWDVSAKRALRDEATDAVIAGELAGGVSGPAALKTAFGDRKETLAHVATATAQENRARAEAFLRQTARRFVVARGTAEADGRIRAGATVELTGLGPLFSGKYQVAEARHLFDGGQGLRTEFVAERPGLGGGGKS
jgi:phage protein D